MKKNILHFLFLLIFSFSFAQEEKKPETFTHKVELGETMVMISKKYLVTPTDVYRLNKHAVEGLNVGMILDIPLSNEYKAKKEKLQELAIKKSNEAKANTKIISHQVIKGDNLYNISKKYNTTKEKIEDENAELLKNGLQVDQVLKISIPKDFVLMSKDDKVISAISTDNKKTSEIIHLVEKGETLYSISKKYNLTEDDLKKQNEEILKDGLKAGQSIKIASSNSTIDSKKTKENTNSTTKKEINSSDSSQMKHKVASKETLYSISKIYNITVQDIIDANPELQTRGVQEGEDIIIKIKTK